MTPTEKDAMALAVLDACAEKLLLHHRRNAEYVGGVEHSDLQERIREARAHLASRIAELESERNEYRADAEIANARATRAEAELAAVREDAERYRWLRDNCVPCGGDEEVPHARIRVCLGRKGKNIHWFDLIGPRNRVGVISLDAAIDAARGGE